MNLTVFNIKWLDDDKKNPDTLTCDFIDCDNSMDDITEIISDWLTDRYGDHDGFIWEFAD